MTATYRVGEGLYVNLTNRCPCACTFCIRQNGDGVYGSDSLWLEREPMTDEVCASIEENFGNCRELVFCGYGEPTERLDTLLEVAARFRKAHPAIPVRVNTNGLSDLIAGEPTAHRFEGLVDAVSISLNAPTAEEYVALCRPKFGAAAYPALLKFAEEVKGFVKDVTLTVVGTGALTSEKEAACRRVAAEHGVPLRVRRFEPKG
ncbi:MAG: TatD family nuclease-associated radical SAM protein [bacterium]|nr:TatD family nuclease-associated radical SAM protein [Candidatus Colisoma equi]